MKYQQRWLVLLLLAHLLLATTFSILNPLGESPDEADHWAYVVHLARERSLPVGPKMTQSKHPPLYHATAALFVSMGQPTNDFLFANPDIQIAESKPWSPNFFIHTTREDFPWQGGVLSFHLARFWSVILSTLTLWATFKLACITFPEQTWIAWSSAGILAFLPEFLFISGSVNNDNGIALLGTLMILAGVYLIKRYEWPNGLKQLWWMPLVVGGGLLTKVSSIGLWPALSFAIFWNAIQQPVTAGQPIFQTLLQRWRQWGFLHTFIFGGALLIAAPWLVRNLTLYGDPLGMTLVRQTIDLRATAWTLADTTWLLQGWFLSLVGKLGGAGHIPLPSWIYKGYALLTLIGLVGLIRYTWQRRHKFCWIPVLFLILAILGVGVTMWSYSLLALGTDQGRLLYPTLAPIILSLGLGLITCFPARWAKAVTLVGIGWSLISAICTILLVLQPRFGPPPSADVTELQLARLDSPIHYAELTLQGWTPDAQSPILYWQLRNKTTRDLRTIMRVVAEDGTLIWEKRRSPGQGRFSTDHWPTTYLMRDVYLIQWPEWAGAGRYRVEVGVQPYGQALIRAAGPTSGADYQLIGWIEYRMLE